MYQISLFDGEHKFENDKPIRLIELFGGYGSQALALKYLGIPFEHWRLSEWAVKSIQAYKDMHFADDTTDYSEDMVVGQVKAWLYGKISADYNTPMTEQQINRLSEKQARIIYNNMQATHNLGSITKIEATDLAVVDTDKYCYVMTYSYPCQDCSLAGKGAGMVKGSGTRSALLWEVERLLNEMPEKPQILIMENVSQVHSEGNREDFNAWCNELEKMGYHNYWQDMNAKDQRIPQNRNRCFMVSILGDYYYTFPKLQKLTVRLKDFLDKKVDEKYYLSDNALKYIDKRLGKYTQICDKETEFVKSAITAVGNQNWTGNFVKEVSNAVRGGTDGVVLGKSPRYQRGLLSDLSRTIDTQGMNGVVEWKK